MPRFNPSHTWATFTLALALVVPGCARSILTGPPATETVVPTARPAAPAPPSRALQVQTLGVRSVPSTLATALDWLTVTASLVRAGEDAIVTGSHYELRFAKGSLEKDATVTIQEYDSGVLDVQFGPSGTRFNTPVQLSIDFAGTSLDPAVDADSGREPVLWYLNEATNKWEEVPGVTDWGSLRHVVRLQHFSRYVLGGKAGWKPQPDRESD